ncbi:MAG: nucleotide exchange factor GrpE [Halieaceae bacterium]
MSSDNNDIQNDEEMNAEVESAETKAADIETDELSEVEALQEEVAIAKDAALRAQADAINAQRRAEMEVEKARKFALERFAQDLLPVVDNLERALEASSGSDAEGMSAVVEGVELTLKSLVDVLSKNGITPVDPHGEPFDPQVAQAMSMIENPDVEPNTVIAVMQKGYLLNDRLLRPAMVMVSKAAS